MSQYIDPRNKLLAHLDTLHALKLGQRPAPVNVEIDLSNRCSLGCHWCLTRTAVLDILGRGKCSIADVRPGDCVLAYNENEGKAQWAEVYAVSKREVSETIYHIVVGSKAIEATGNHEVFTRRGWVDARHLTTIDEVAHVSETMRVRLRSSRKVEGVAVLSRSRADSRDATCQQRTYEGQQSDETPRGVSETIGDMEGEWRRQGGSGEDEGVAGRWEDSAAGYYISREGTSVCPNEARQSYETRQCGCQSQSGTSGEWCGCTSGRTVTPIVEEARVSRRASGTHEGKQSDAPHRSAGKESERAASAPCRHEDGNVVCGTGQPESMADLVLRPERVLGEWAQSRLQGSRSQVSDRDNGRLDLSQTSADTRQLFAADDSALRSEWARLLSGDDARAALQMARSATERFGDDCLGFPGDWQECDLEFQRITHIAPMEMTTEVFNLETSTATYFANDLLVHNCHFAYTHTRGPLAGKVGKPHGAIDGGDLMNTNLAYRIVSDLHDEGVKSITWTGGGEPTLHPDFDDIVRYAAALGLEQGIYTHGGHIDNARARLLKDLFAWVYISLDECEAETYKASKGVDRFDAVCANVRRLVEAEGDATIGLGFLLHKDNAHQVHEMVRLGRSLGVDYVQFRPTVQYDQEAPGELVESDLAWTRRAMGMANAYKGDSFVIADRDRFEMYSGWRGHGYSTCNWSALQTVITPNGKVWRCTNKREHPDALLGDLSAESFATLWERSGGPCAVNAGCRILCKGHIGNQVLETVLREQAHANFV